MRQTRVETRVAAFEGDVLAKLEEIDGRMRALESCPPGQHIHAPAPQPIVVHLEHSGDRSGTGRASSPDLQGVSASGQHRAMAAAQADGMFGAQQIEAVAHGAATDVITANELARLKAENQELRASGDKWKTYVIVTFVGLLLTGLGGLIVFLAGRAFPSQPPAQSAPARDESRRGGDHGR